MNYSDFVSEVQTEAGLDSIEEAARVAEATLETLGERLEETELRLLAAQLPNELKEFLHRRDDTPYKYDLEEFYNRVSARADIGYPDAVRQSRSVIAVLCRAVSRGEIDDVLYRLPFPFGELFGKEPAGALSPTLKPIEGGKQAEEGA